MFFTRENIQKISKGIFEQGVKDTDFKVSSGDIKRFINIYFPRDPEV